MLVSHDGERWLPTVLEGLAGQLAPIAHCVAVDTGSKDASADLLADAFGRDSVVTLPSSTGFPGALRAGLAHLDQLGADTEWVWVLHDDASPHPEALLALLAGAADDPDADVLGPMLREWPSLKRLLELGVTISGTGRRETGLERGEYDQGQYSEPRHVLAVNTAGMLVRRRVLDELGGSRRRAADLRQRPRLRVARRRGRPPDRRGAAGRGLPRRGGTPRAAAYAADRPPHPLPGAAGRAVHPARELPVPGLAAAGRPAGVRHLHPDVRLPGDPLARGRARRPRGVHLGGGAPG